MNLPKEERLTLTAEKDIPLKSINFSNYEMAIKRRGLGEAPFTNAHLKAALDEVGLSLKEGSYLHFLMN